MTCLVTVPLTFEFLDYKKNPIVLSMVRGKLLYSNLQMSKPLYHCAIRVLSDWCLGVYRLLRN